MGRFIHLHNHSHFSLLDASSQISDMVKRAKELDMSAVALTDHGNMSGAVQLWRACKKENLKAIIGCELYIATTSHSTKRRKKGERNYHHLVVWAQNKEGYENLCKLIAISYLEGFYYKPRVDEEDLKRHSKGLVASTACLVGNVPRALLFDAEGNLADQDPAIASAKTVVQRLQGIFEDRFYLELQDHGIELQRLLNYRLVALARETGLPLIWTNDCHFLRKEEYIAHKCLKCIQGYKKVNDPAVEHVYLPTHHFRSEEDMRAILEEKDDGNLRYGPVLDMVGPAFDRTAEIAGMCDFSFTEGKYFFPEVPMAEKKSIPVLFREQVIEGFGGRVDRGQVPEDQYGTYYERLLYEMRLISEMGFEDYFLIVADMVQWARKQGIPVGPGRGSAAGSIVSWSLQITDLDPIQHGLLFERFLNPERVSMPDIDLDFSKRRRHEVIDYVVERYGRDNVAQIATFHTLAPRRVLGDLGRVFGLTIPDAQRFAALIPDTPGKPFTLERAYEEIEEFRRETKVTGIHTQIYEVAKRLEGANRHVGIHAAGLVITPEPVVKYAPLYQHTGSQDVAAGYDMRDLESIGLVKMDLLGLKTLDVIADTVQLVRRRHRVDIDWDDIELEDPKVYKLFADGKTKGVFQFESRGMRQALMKLGPTCFDDIVAMNALFRPGPMDAKIDGKSLMERYIDRKQGREPATPFHPAVKDSVDNTYGVLVFQEQVMQTVRKLAGYSLGQADVVRKAMGKKDAKLMKTKLDEFIEAGVKMGFPKDEITGVADTIQKFARYGFNRAHAAAYAYIAFQTAWLACYYPLEFMCSVLTSESEDNKFEKVREYIGDAKKMDIEILPPNVNHSGAYFAVEKDAIRYGLASIKGIGAVVANEIIQERTANGPFTSFVDFLYRMKPTKSLLDPLINAGATECLMTEVFEDRNTHLQNYPDILKSFKKHKQAEGQMNIFDMTGDADRIRKEAYQLKAVAPANAKDVAESEKKVLGLWLTHHPLERFRSEIKDDIASLKDAAERSMKGFKAEIVCVVTSTSLRHTRAGKQLLIVGGEDMSAETEEIKVWGESDIESLKDVLVVDAIVKLKGRAGKDKNGRFQFSVRSGERLDSYEVGEEEG